ncbi:MAG TPA: N-acyl-D-glutamate deacylase [Nevskia sp.]|nr:N-acyl-D-glutamate deacylase [Nevskia sp.]
MEANVTLFRNATLFDGSGSEPRTADLLVRDGRVAAIGPNLAVPAGARSIDCSGRWLMPGLLDIHTHLDLEVELAPELPEAVRHGTTTVVMSNCSLGVAYGNQRRGDQDPIVDCFARVENVPKHVLRKVGDAVTWNDSGDYLEHFERLPLGPNVVPMIPHSMLRIEVMGLQDSISREPTEDELKRMEALLEKGMREGYAGFSTDALPFHYLANRPNTRKQIPTQFAPFFELKRLTAIVRRWDRVWQATPPKDSRLGTLRTFLLSSGRLYGKRLRTTAVAAIDLHTNRLLVKLALRLSKLINSKLVGGLFRFQALSAPFKLWSDGVITPIAEEIPELRVLNECDLDDHAGRLRILNDPHYVRAFRRMWHKGKRGFNLANLMRILGNEQNVLSRRLDDMTVESCPLPGWSGEKLEAPYRRLLAWQAGRGAAQDAEEEAFFKTFPHPAGDDADFVLHLLRQWDTRLRWHTTTANRDPRVVKDLLFHPLTLPGFNDSGAHLTNMAFYDGNLRTLKIAQQDGLRQVAIAVHRMTQLPAQFWGLNSGLLVPGAQADLCVVEPRALRAWEPEATIRYIRRDLFDCHQLVNRPDGVVSQVMVAGKLAWNEGAYTPAYGRERFGRVLRAKDHPAERALGQDRPGLREAA